ncbi:metallophosphoesterase [Pleionea sp. CnH1-48]|nr:metallophosphoesterase [Pleionea sp. CnH1-48]
MTEFGHPGEWSETENLLNILSEKYWYGLGNHDYANNSEDCGADLVYKNGCALRSLEKLEAHIKSKDNISNVDWISVDGYNDAVSSTTAYGSLAYSFELGGIRYIQLNNYASYEDDVDSNHWDVKVASSESWLIEQMIDARKRGKAIILNSHVADLSDSIKSYAKKYGANIRFAGHYHKLHGKHQYYDDFIFVGSPMYKTMMIAELDYLSKKMRIYKVKNNDIASRV